MTIRRGLGWGEEAAAPQGLTIVHTDREASEWMLQQALGPRPLPSVGLAGGDLALTVGGGSPGRFSGPVMTASTDVLRVEAADRRTVAVAHVVARRSWWRGELWFAMNAQFMSGYDVAPRSHPNDGKLDVLHVLPGMSLRARLHARRRARTGTHLPHPELVATQVVSCSVVFERPLSLWVDGVKWGTAGSVTITCDPDALTIYA